MEVPHARSQSTPMNRKILFTADVQQGVLSVAELARRYDISRETGVKGVNRFDAQVPMVSRIVRDYP
jgi:transposase